MDRIWGDALTDRDRAIAKKGHMVEAEALALSPVL
jgi:hypothetical protein